MTLLRPTKLEKHHSETVAKYKVSRQSIWRDSRGKFYDGRISKQFHSVGKLCELFRFLVDLSEFR